MGSTKKLSKLHYKLQNCTTNYTPRSIGCTYPPLALESLPTLTRSVPPGVVGEAPASQGTHWNEPARTRRARDPDARALPRPGHPFRPRSHKAFCARNWVAMRDRHNTCLIIAFLGTSQQRCRCIQPQSGKCFGKRWNAQWCSWNGQHTQIEPPDADCWAARTLAISLDRSSSSVTWSGSMESDDGGGSASGCRAPLLAILPPRSPSPPTQRIPRQLDAAWQQCSDGIKIASAISSVVTALQIGPAVGRSLQVALGAKCP